MFNKPGLKCCVMLVFFFKISKFIKFAGPKDLTNIVSPNHVQVDNGKNTFPFILCFQIPAETCLKSFACSGPTSKTMSKVHLET